MLEGISELVEFRGIGRNRVDVRWLGRKQVERQPICSASAPMAQKRGCG